ncbi:hypothetical protein [Peribacillus acanthi]|uniref:hypothetical protein n=1 Tax=Peribacillus acanthi TaxID=2171554 RepID=UPI000D3E590D|nr:hypothetical protein [Peribacillus acanthi]
MVFTTPLFQGSIPNNGMYIRNNSSNGTESNQSWKLILEDEARKINPLFDVKVSQNSLIMESIQKNDWSKYHSFQAKQHPAWYQEVDGKQIPNKIYFGNLIESKLESLQEARMNGDQKEVEKWEKNLLEAIEDFKKAPGIVPYVVGLNHTEKLAAQYEVEQPSEEYFNSKYNSSLVMDQGKFKENMWYENAIFEENVALKNKIETLVAGTFPVSASKENVAVETSNDSVSKENVESSIEELNKNVEGKTSPPNQESSFEIQTLIMQNLAKLQQTIKPNPQEIIDKYRYS